LGLVFTTKTFRLCTAEDSEFHTSIFREFSWKIVSIVQYGCPYYSGTERLVQVAGQPISTAYRLPPRWHHINDRVVMLCTSLNEGEFLPF